MEIIEHYGLILLVLAVAFGFFMAWGVGANDVANAMGTSVGAGALTIKQAVIIAAVFEFAGAYLAGDKLPPLFVKVLSILLFLLIHRNYWFTA